MSMKKILGCIRKADREYNLIQENDRICIGVSGGKDSMLLLYCMHLYQKFADKKFEIVGVHIKLGFPNMDFTEAIHFFESKGIEFHLFESQVYDILKVQANEDGTLKCSLCSTLKKGIVIDSAKKLNCNKIAFGHHADDAIETLLMNAIYGGRLATFKPTMYMSRTDTTFIRPFVYAYESDIEKAIMESKVPIVRSTCPMDGYTKRTETKHMLNDLYEKYPMAKDNFLLMLHNDDKTDLWHPVNKKK